MIRVFITILCNVPRHPEWTLAITLFIGSYIKNIIQSAEVVIKLTLLLLVINPSYLSSVISKFASLTTSAILTLSVCPKSALIELLKFKLRLLHN